MVVKNHVSTLLIEVNNVIEVVVVVVVRPLDIY